LAQLSLADDDASWPCLKVAPGEVTPLPSDFAAGQLDPDNMFDPEIGALRRQHAQRWRILHHLHG
jgi:hypothetical protein